ncbi:hypothetical protein [Paenibacillus sp. FSL H7-0331]|uniref:hypothetical protein n=1 Tax=Paenibacillus sp. FSL H7-0331 TaxID=1920421 RepID=UPI00096F4ECD|nr:hypothetical protein [Paenibacillus sp. FSL H7-0331]OMF06082.1 hypothetical protein BK127_31585 [Paenibacillus sp. FSL H7-0331]
MILAIIIGCEIAFWLFVIAGLACRYLLGRKKMSVILLYCTPVIDCILLISAVVDLKGGAQASFSHGLAAIYIGASIAFGHRMIRWLDVHFAHWFAGGPAPLKKVKFGDKHAREERSSFLLHLFAWAIGCVILYGMIIMVNEGSRTAALLQVMQIWSLVLAIDFLISFSYTLWPRKKKGTS